MEDLTAIKTDALLVMLSQYTEDYIRLRQKGTKEEFEQCKEDIALLQKELKLRREAEINS